MCGKNIPVLALLALVGTAGVLAQSVEITPFYGAQFWGDFETYGLDDRFTVEDLELEESDTYGLMLDISLRDDTQIEISWSHQETEVELDPNLFLGPAVAVDVNIDYFQLGGLYLFDQRNGRDKIQPFASGSLGVAYLDPKSGFGDTTRFSLHIGGGVKLFFSKHVGLRFDARFKTTYIDSETDLYCDPNFCFGYTESSSWLYQTEVTAGLTFGF